MNSGTEALKGRKVIEELQFNIGLVECAIRQSAAMEGKWYLCYIPRSSSSRKKNKKERRNYFSFQCNRNISMLSNFLLYLNFYAIIDFPKHLCCLQPKADFKSEPLSLFFLQDSRIQIYLGFSFLVCEIKTTLNPLKPLNVLNHISSLRQA